MAQKVFMYAVVWIAVIFAYILMGFTMSATNSIVSDTSSQFDSQNMTGIIGVQEAVESSPYWMWALPGTVGIVVTVVMLKRD